MNRLNLVLCVLVFGSVTYSIKRQAQRDREVSELRRDLEFYQIRQTQKWLSLTTGVIIGHSVQASSPTNIFIDNYGYPSSELRVYNWPDPHDH